MAPAASSVLLALALVCTCSTGVSPMSVAVTTVETTESSLASSTTVATAEMSTDSSTTQTPESPATETATASLDESTTSSIDATTGSTVESSTDVTSDVTTGTTSDVTDDVTTGTTSAVNAEATAGVTTDAGAPDSVAKEMCEEPTLDAAVKGADGKKYVFKGDKVLEKQGKEKPTVRDLSEVFPGGPSSVDAAITIDTKLGPRTLLFQGEKLWDYQAGEEGMELEGEGPRTILSQLGVPGPVDAAFSLDKDKHTFFLGQGDKLWRLKLHRNGRLRVSNPRPRKDFRELKDLPPFTSAISEPSGDVFLLDKDVHYALKKRGKKAKEALPNELILGCTTPPNTTDSSLVASEIEVDPIPDFESDPDVVEDLEESSAKKNSRERKDSRQRSSKEVRSSRENSKKASREKSKKSSRERSFKRNSRERKVSKESSRERRLS